MTPCDFSAAQEGADRRELKLHGVSLPSEVCEIFATGPLSEVAHIGAFITSEGSALKRDP